MTDLRYPIGRFDFPNQLSAEQREQAIGEVAQTPHQLRDAVVGLSPAQLDTPYRPDGWTVRQVVHHLPDSHLNAYTRFKLALTEDKPTIRAYDEARWAELPDSQEAPEVSLNLLDTLHKRWVYLLRHIDETAWERQFHHPEIGDMRLDTLLGLYAWHGRHHVAHITTLRQSRGW